MEEMPQFGLESKGKEIPLSFDAGEKTEIPITQTEKKTPVWLNKIKKAIGIGAIASAVLSQEACSPDAGQGEASVTGVASQSEKSNRTAFSGYGISTETEGGKLKESSYGKEDKGKKGFKGYGIER